MKRDLGFYHLGNGLSVCDKLHEKDGDYQKIAHISPDRKITWYVKNLAEKDRVEIEHEAYLSDPSASYSQPERKVFSSRPATEKRFTVDGHEGSLEEFLKENEHDEELCKWLNICEVGYIFCGCERIK